MKTDEEYFEEVVEDIEKLGRRITGVFAGEENPTFFYSIGNSRHGSDPMEFISFFPATFTAGVINRVAEDLLHNPVEAKKVLDPAAISLAEGYLNKSGCDIALRRLTGITETIVRERYACQLDVPHFAPYIRPHALIQIVLPDMENLFPGTEGFDPRLKDSIPEFLHLPEQERWNDSPCISIPRPHEKE